VLVILGVYVCICDCVVFYFLLFLSVLLVLLHFVRNKLNIARPCYKSGIDSVPHVLYKVRREKCLLKAKRLNHSLLRALCIDIDILNPD